MDKDRDRVEYIGYSDRDRDSVKDSDMNRDNGRVMDRDRDM